MLTQMTALTSGNQVVGSGGATVDGVDVTNVYDSADGGTALRILTVGFFLIDRWRHV